MAAPLKLFRLARLCCFSARYTSRAHVNQMGGAVRYFCENVSPSKTATEFDENILKYVVCPLSKRPLRYDKENNELVCDEIQVAYPIVNGIPNLIPHDARRLDTNSSSDSSSDSNSGA